MCGSSAVVVVEDVPGSGVVVYACEHCAATWADRLAEREEEDT